MSVLLLRQLEKRITRLEKKVGDPEAVKERIRAGEAYAKTLPEGRERTAFEKRLERLRTSDQSEYAEELKRLKALYEWAKDRPEYQPRRGRRRAAKKRRRAEA